MGTITDLVEHYNALGERFVVRDETARYANLVTASTTSTYPVQRWFHFKEAFALDLLETLITQWNIESDSVTRILDPFCGTGTSILAAQRWAKKLGRDDIEVVGLERNPFLHFVAHTKAHWHQYAPDQLRAHSAHLLNGVAKPLPSSLPALSTLHREEVYQPETFRELLGFRSAISQTTGAERAAMLLGYASVLESLSGVRKDGRALRIMKDKSAPKSAVAQALNNTWQMFLEDSEAAVEHFHPISSQVLLGNGRTLSLEEESNSSAPAIEGGAPLFLDRNCGKFDVVFYSPPYLNNIDYTEVYKIELWMCGFINDAQAFTALRHETMRSHPSIRFRQPVTYLEDAKTNPALAQAAQTLEELIGAIPDDDSAHASKHMSKERRTALFQGYFDDMYQALKHQKQVLRPGGWIFCVVGNSMHGAKKAPGEDVSESRVPVASDLIIALLAEAVGLEVQAIEVARLLTRNLKRETPGRHLRRESIVVMRKPQ